MSIDAPTKILDLPTGPLYQHTMFSSYTMFSHRETLTKIDKMGYILQKMTERVTMLEGLVKEMQLERSGPSNVSQPGPTSEPAGDTGVQGRGDNQPTPAESGTTVKPKAGQAKK